MQKPPLEGNMKQGVKEGKADGADGEGGVEKDN